MKVIEVEGSVAVFLPEHPSNCGILESVVKEGPLVTKLDHIFDTFLTLLLERYGGGGLKGGVQHQCAAQTGCRFRFLWWG